MGKLFRKKRVPKTPKASEVPGRPRRSKLGWLVGKLNPFALIAPRHEPVQRPWFTAEPIVAERAGRVLREYSIGLAKVAITDDRGKGRYLVSEPPLTPKERRLYRTLIENIFFSMRPEPLAAGGAPEILEGAIWDAAHDIGLMDEVRASFAKLRYYILKDGLGYGKLHTPMLDPDIEEISVVSFEHPAAVIHRDFTRYGWLETNLYFSSEDELRAYNQRLAQRTGKSLSTAAPILDSTTKEGDRIALTFGDEVSYPGTALSVRKFPREPISLPALIDRGALSPELAAYIWQDVEFKGPMWVLGVFGSGKTTLMNAALACVPPNLKVCTVEDIHEIKLPQPNWLRLHTRTGHLMIETRYDIDFMDLVRTAMRHRPDYLLIGEVRGAEIRALIQAAAAGRCAVTTFHADSPEMALVRMRADPMNVSEGGLMLIWCFVQLAYIRMPGGEWVRRVTRVDEVIPGEPLKLQPVFRWDPRRDTFAPRQLSEIVRRSYRLRKAASARGMTDAELREALRKKVEVLRRLIKQRRLGFEQFSEQMRDFYKTVGEKAPHFSAGSPQSL